MSILGTGKDREDFDEETRSLVDFSMKVLEHQDAFGRAGSLENPGASVLFKDKKMQKAFGSIPDGKKGWKFYQTQGCQHNYSFPGVEDPGKPIQKSM
jgi:hypothetical protein